MLPHSPVLISYGGDYWCRPDIFVPTLLDAIKCYNIDIKTRGNWQALPQYKQLCMLLRPSTILPTSTAGTTVPPMVRVKGGYFGNEPRQLSLTHFWQVLSHRRMTVLPGSAPADVHHLSLPRPRSSTPVVPPSPKSRKRRRPIPTARARKRCTITAEDCSPMTRTRSYARAERVADILTARSEAWDNSVIALNLPALKAIFSASDVPLPVR